MTELLHDYVSEQAERHSDAVALVMGAERVTYGQLEEASNRLARQLRELGCGRDGVDRVCIFAAKSPDAIVGMLATLKAGCAYVPIDVASPAARTARIVASAQPSAVLVGGAAIALTEELLRSAAIAPGLPLGALDARVAGSELEVAFGPDDVAQQEANRLAVRRSPDDPAHLLFTSGSTGEPKGVVILHRNATAFMEWANDYFQTRAGDRISGHPPLHFDLSTFDIYGTFRAGAELHLVPPDVLLPQQLAALIVEHELTQWFSVPSTFTYMAKFDAVPDGGFPSLERVLWCGEVLPTPVLAHWMRRITHARYTNLYGPTEATIASSYYTVPEVPADETAPIPIGVACAGEELLVLDEERRPVPTGEIGDLYIAGAGLSPGYWRDEEKTRSVFFDDPRAPASEGRIYLTGDLALVDDDGLAQFVGRADSQIKSRGYRIELGEIEAAVNAVPELVECGVVALESDGFEGATICCAFVPDERSEIEPPALRAVLAKALPSYMLPQRWIRLDVLPKNVNGKIDRKRLREIFAETLTARAR